MLLRIRLETVPRILFWTTALVVAAGIATCVAWWRTGDVGWIRGFFFYPGALFLVGCNLLGLRLSYRCWRQFSQGDMLRPAWLLITCAAAAQLCASLVRQVLGAGSLLNPLSYFQGTHELINQTFQLGGRLSPFYMAFLAAGLFRVLQVCRRHGVLGALKPVDLALLGIVIVYTVHYVSGVVFSPQQPEGPATIGRIIGWTSDPLLCVLLLEAILIRRSTANMGWGLISRCWLAFTAAIFLTSVGDIGMWAATHHYGPYALEAASWYVWFLPGACFAVAPAYQLQAMLHATHGHHSDEALQPAEDLSRAAG